MQEPDEREQRKQVIARALVCGLALVWVIWQQPSPVPIVAVVPLPMEETQPGWGPATSPAVSSPIRTDDGDCGYNVVVAIEANGGALQNVTIAPGDTFSFNATMGDPAAIAYRNCAGVPGGNWCNLAARYAQVARALGITPQFQDHGVGDLGGGPENSVAIWNEGGVAGAGQDLLITNTTTAPVSFRVIVDGGALTVEGY